MVGNRPGDNSGNILVEFDYNNIIIVDPNKTIDALGNIRERIVDHEKLVMFANLEAAVIPRTKLSVGGSPDDTNTILSIAKINFLRPTENTSLTTSYYDELTGKNSRNGLGDNQLRVENIEAINNNTPYQKVTVNNPGNKSTDNGLLGITSIDIRTNTSFTPRVTIILEDIQGRALFQLGDNSPYSAFFNLPYCPFYLTLKGYYGQAIKYQLNLEKFHATFNSFNGNYQITLDFVGYKFNILNEISMGHLLATPHMYSTRFDISKSETSSEAPNKNIESGTKQTGTISNDATNSTNNIVTEVVSEKGYQKIVEVYSEYKSKGLIDPNFPELTFAELINKLETFETTIINSYSKIDIQPLTNIRAYKETLTNYYNNIYGNQTSWFNTNINQRPIVLKDGTFVYTFKKEILEDKIKQQEALERLNGDTMEFNILLSSNKTLGDKAISEIKNPITNGTYFINVTRDQIDEPKTIIGQTNKYSVTDEDRIKVIDYLDNVLFKPAFEVTNGDPENKSINLIYVPLFVFKAESSTNKTEPRFINLIYQIEAEVNRKLSEYETALTADFARKIEDNKIGLGFSPTVRNICAVIMASSEAFIRLLDEVHTNAWNVKYDPTRQLAILDNPSSAPGTDTLGVVNISENANEENQGLITSKQPVYPWPQYFVETPEDKKGRFQLKYPGDPSVVDKTDGWDYSKWPEVEFVEEYMRGLTQKFNPPLTQVPTDNLATTNIININAIEYPSNGIAYLNKAEIKFFYEIWERQFLTSNYSGFIRANRAQLGQLTELVFSSETTNIVSSLGVSSPFLTLKLKNEELTAQNYVQFLQNISNQGTGRSYQEFIRDFFVTPYIRNLTENSFNILTTNQLGKEPQNNAKVEALLQLVKGSNNTPLIVDTYPFTNPTWVSNNMSLSNQAQGELVYNTNQTLTVFTPRNVISNFNSVYNYTTNRPVTNFSYLNITNPVNEINSTNLTIFLDSRKNPDNFIPTEGYVNHFRRTTNLTTETTTTMLNTPYLVNAIQNGVNNWRRRDKYPYVQAAYLFINSLPLASLRERYKTYGAPNDLDYIASCFKKYGAIHKMPYAWVLKMGSLWYRYKTYKTTGIDFLETAWENFDYKVNFDPVTSSDTKTYTFQFDGEKQIRLQNNTNVTNSQIQIGFYPKVINDFNVFYNGYDLYREYTDSEIQTSINGGMKVYNFTDSNINPNSSAQPTVFNRTSIETWSVILPDNVIDPTEIDATCSPSQNTTSVNYFIVPSFGSPINQVNVECLQNNVQTVPLLNNSSVYNGSIRLLWSAPNYGYFDNDQIVVPQPDSYVNQILTGNVKQAPFKLLLQDDYSKIEEIFSVFDKSILDQFEQEFLNFSKPVVDIDLGPQVVVPINESPVDNNAVFKNFQYLFRSLMSVNAPISLTNSEYFNDLGEKQLIGFSNTIKSFMEFDVILKYGNPTNYKRRIVDSFLASNGGNNPVVDPIQFNPYVSNTLPSLNGTITLAQSQALYSDAWLALETEVGFSTILNLRYTNQGSYITDFFIDNNIEFSVDNVVLCSQIIKQYATQKLYIPTINSAQFKINFQDYLRETSAIQNLFLNEVLSRVRAELPNQQALPEKKIPSVVDGQQSKVEFYEIFKALNDKWISGGDFTNKTLYEDFLFLDRASRNIGDILLVDIFDLKDILTKSSVNMGMSVFTFLSGLLIKNKFNVMPLPSYVNFYNVQDADGTILSQSSEGSSQFADNMWGTFLDVDYRKSGPKVICFYTGLPSAHLELPKGNSRYRNDSFELRRASENPLIENQVGKQDWAISNKCVGFNVDIGNRNQNIFYSFDITMNDGQATSESIQALYNMVNQASGRDVATQNTGLYSFYKQRSYQCRISCLGNALLQPTMYFNLRHVPMFNGPYLITEVNHIITAGDFKTEFGGIRQGIYDLPSIDNFLQSINQNLLTQIETIIQTNKDNITDKPITNINKTASLTQKGDNVAAATNTCTNNLNSEYSTWGNFVESVTIGLTPLQLADAIRGRTTNTDLQTTIYLLCYVLTFNENKFEGYNNNFASIELNTYWGTAGKDFFIEEKASCVKLPNSLGARISQPIANFENLDKFLDFMIARLSKNIRRIYVGENGNAPLGIPKYYVCYWKPPSNGISNISETFFDENQDLYKDLYDTIRKAYGSAGEVGLDFESARNAAKLQTQQIANVGEGATNNINTTTLSPPTCPPPTIVSFSPLTGVTGTILNVTGTDLNSITAVTINGVTTTTGITINNSTNIVVLVPFSNTGVPQNNTITVRGEFGVGNSVGLFTYNPLQTSAAPPTVAPNIPANYNTNSQQTGEPTFIGVTQNGVTILGTALIEVNVNPLLSATYSMLPPFVVEPTFTFKVGVPEIFNNSELSNTLYESGSITLGTTYFQSPTSFKMNQADILSVITTNWETPPSNSTIICMFTINAGTVSPPELKDSQSFKLTIQL